jgi:hypothetical protein
MQYSFLDFHYFFYITEKRDTHCIWFWLILQYPTHFPPKNVAVSLHRITQGTGTLPSLFFNNSKINQRNCYFEMDILEILYQYYCYVAVSRIEKDIISA